MLALKLQITIIDINTMQESKKQPIVDKLTVGLSCFFAVEIVK